MFWYVDFILIKSKINDYIYAFFKIKDLSENTTCQSPMKSIIKVY